MSSFIAMPIDRSPSLIDADYESLFQGLSPTRRRPWRANRFRIYFRVPRGHPAIGVFGTDLFENFQQYFDQASAKVRQIEKRHGGRPVLRFTGDVPGPDLHSDYVSRNWFSSESGFAVQTLQRLYEDDNDTKIRAILKAMGFVSAPSAALALTALAPLLGKNPVFASMARAARRDLVRFRITGDMSSFTDDLADFVVALNKRHFLAGRRSWRIHPARVVAGDGRVPEGDDIFMLETAAIERIARIEFLPGAEFFDRKAKEIWATMLRQYVQMKGFQPVAHWAFDDGEYADNVSITHSEFDTKSACANATAVMRGLHPDLTTVGMVS